MTAIAESEDMIAKNGRGKSNRWEKLGTGERSVG